MTFQELQSGFYRKTLSTHLAELGLGAGAVGWREVFCTP